jgi:hypothetical protein
MPSAAKCERDLMTEATRTETQDGCDRLVDAATLRVRAAMLTCPVEHHASVTVGELRAFFRDHHVHIALLLDDGVLVAAVEPADLQGAHDGTPALPLGRLDGRAVSPDMPLVKASALMRAGGIRRLAVTVEGDVLVGLLCLKRHRNGFCSNNDVAERIAERQARRAMSG